MFLNKVKKVQIVSDNKTMNEKPNDFAKLFIIILSFGGAWYLHPHTKHLTKSLLSIPNDTFYHLTILNFAVVSVVFLGVNYVLIMTFFCGDDPLIISIWDSIKDSLSSILSRPSHKRSENERMAKYENVNPDEDLDISFVDNEMSAAPPPVKKEKKLSHRELDIIFFLSEWRAISLQCLYDNFSHTGSYSNFSRIIQKLVEQNFIKYILQEQRGRNKFITLDEKGYDYTDATKDLNASYYKHDITATTVVLSLSKIPPFFSSIPPGYSDYSLNPDGILLGHDDGSEFRVAVEIELSAKSKSRISEKTKSYIRDKDFKKVLYIFRDEHLFHLFQKIINQSEQAKEKFVLNLDKNLSPTSYNPDKSQWWPSEFESCFLET